MAPKKELTGDERRFFELVHQAGIANPFSEKRVTLDSEISGLYPQATQKERIDKAVAEVNRRIDRLKADGRSRLDLFSGDDRRLAKAAFLFEFFYKFRKNFDQHIQAQLAAGDNPLKLNFSNKALTLLRGRGFSEEESRRYFALGYQLRRAFFFIRRTLIGRSNTMTRLRRHLWQNVFTHNIEFYDRYLWNRMEDFSTLILGETGTGKGTAALAIGRSGYIPFNERKKTFLESFPRAFVSLNLSQFPETLIESELFGHKKGAFTGAVKDFKGVFNRCSPHGAIFLDEIGEVSPQLQIKLLHVLQERAFCPVGSHEPARFEGRVIAATNRSIETIREKKIFRDDFYYRLSSDVIHVPPLRQRIQEDPKELDDLLVHTVRRLVGRSSPELVKIIREIVDRELGRDYPWPGNVRELEQCVRRIILSRHYEGRGKAQSNDLGAVLTQKLADGDIDAQRLVSGYCRMLYERCGTFEEVARRTHLDRRTVKKYIQEWDAEESG
jgi:DNA-binding NtrC family response regulator